MKEKDNKGTKMKNTITMLINKTEIGDRQVTSKSTFSESSRICCSFSELSTFVIFGPEVANKKTTIKINTNHKAQIIK